MHQAFIFMPLHHSMFIVWCQAPRTLYIYKDHINKHLQLHLSHDYTEPCNVLCNQSKKVAIYFQHMQQHY